MSIKTEIEWFKLDDKIPHRDKPILIKTLDGIFSASLCGESWKGICDEFHFLPQSYEPHSCDKSKVTHWAYLSELPEFE